MPGDTENVPKVVLDDAGRVIQIGAAIVGKCKRCGERTIFIVHLDPKATSSWEYCCADCQD